MISLFFALHSPLCGAQVSTTKRSALLNSEDKMRKKKNDGEAQ